MDSYKELLDKAYEQIAKTEKKERFTILEIDSLIQGRKTIIRNLSAIAKNLDRNIQEIAKFFAKETGAQSNVDNGKLILNSPVGFIRLKQVYKAYIDRYVLCSQCKKPDTKIINEKGVHMLKCLACGAITPLKKI